jgi:polyhydroxyalkanoate synthesis regulator phasin
MAAPDSTERGLLEGFLLAAVGAVALTAERMEQLADAMAERGGLRSDEARQILEEVSSHWRGEAGRLGERAGANVQRLLRELNVVTRDDFEELELKVAQLEHRLRQLEGPPRAVAPPPQQ